MLRQRLVMRATDQTEQAVRLKKLIEANQTIARVESLDELFPLLMSLAKEVTNAEASSIMRYRPNRNVLEFELASNEGTGNLDKILREKITLRLGEGVAGWVGENRQSVNIRDAQNDPRFSRRADSETGFVTRAILCSPILHEQELLGVVQVLNPKSSRNFDDGDLEILEAFAGLAAVAIVRSRLLENLIAQEKLQAAKNAADIVEAAADAIITFGIESLRIRGINPAAMQIFGYEHDEFIDMSLLQLLEHGEDEDILDRIFSGELHELPGMRKDSQAFPMEAVVRIGGKKGEEFFIGTFRDVTRKNEALRKLYSELSKAADYVKTLLPSPITDGPLRAHWRFIPSTSLGGDSFGYHWVDDEHFAIYLLDVCGHGVHAALLSVSVINVLQSQSLPGTDFKEPDQVLNSLNNAFPMERHNEMYFTMWYGVYNQKTRTLVYASGGHPPALLMTSGPKGRIRPIGLKTPNMFIGGMPNVKYKKNEVQIEGKCRLFVFSDGVYEIETPEGVMWKYDEFTDFMANVPPNEGAEMDHLFGHAKKLCGEDTLDDDFSIMEVVFD